MTDTETKQFTVDEMLQFNPRDEYTRERITMLWAGRERCGAVEIIGMDIPPQDIVWACTLPGMLTDEQRDLWLKIVVTRAVKNHAQHCGVHAVEAWAVKWLSGEDRSARAARAARAAWAAEAAAWAAEAAATAAAAEAAEAAAWAAEAAAAAGAGEERIQQVADLRTVLNQPKG
jgi:hypothetical protein